MNQPAALFNPEDWDNFTHSRTMPPCNNNQIFQAFKAFQTRFNSLSQNELLERGWIDSLENSSSFGRLFFALHSDRNNVLFRKSASVDEVLLELWLSIIREKAEYICITQSIPKFELLTKQYLKEIAQISVDINTIRELPAILAKQGVILVYLRALTGMKTDGAAFRLSSGHMVIGISFRFARLDYFWFTLMHELAHLVLHGGFLENPVLVDVEDGSLNVSEKAANKLAKDSFVDRGSWRNCEPKYEAGDNPVKKYAEQQHVHPAIIAGLLRKESGNYTRYSAIINQYDVRKIIFDP